MADVFTIGSSTVSGNNGGGDPPPSGGAVGGAVNLTHAGAITQVSGSGVISESFVSQSAGVITVEDTTAATGDTKLVVKAGAGQASNLQEWQDNTGTVASYIAPSGLAFTMTDGTGTMLFGVEGDPYQSLVTPTRFVFFDPATFTAGLNSDNSITTFSFNFSTLTIQDNTATTGDTKLVVKAGEGQSGNLIEAQTNAGGVVASISDLGGLRTAPTTVGALPAAAAGNAGTIHYVTDANATTIGSTVAAGGSNKVLVWSNGTAWHIMAN